MPKKHNIVSIETNGIVINYEFDKAIHNAYQILSLL